MPADISTVEDVQKLVYTFYDKVKNDNLLGPVFETEAQTNWEHHLPKMVDFWSTQLLGTGTYKGRPFPPHLQVNIDKSHFSRWLKLFVETVDENFVGSIANEAKQRALNIAQVFVYKIASIKGDTGVNN